MVFIKISHYICPTSFQAVFCHPQHKYAATAVRSPFSSYPQHKYAATVVRSPFSSYPQHKYAATAVRSPFSTYLQTSNLFFSKPTIAVDPKWFYTYWSWTKTDMTFILAKVRGLTVGQNWHAPTEQYNRKNQRADLLYKLQHFSAWGHHHDLQVNVHKYVRIFIKFIIIIIIMFVKG